MSRPLLSIALALFSFASLSAQKAAPSSQQSPILPSDFAGWHQSAPAQQSTAAEAADQANVAVLREYGFAEFASANYVQPDNKLNVRAIRFQDATGAYGAFTFYRRPGMRKEDIGSEGAFDGSHVLFWKGATLVDATFDHITAMSAAQLRELAQDLPSISGPSSIAPPLPGYLPPASLDASSVRYAVGTESYRQGGGVLPPDELAFDRDAEAVTAHYSTTHGNGTLTLLMYPTPQIAINRARVLTDFLNAGGNSQWPQPLTDSLKESLQVRRSGPIVAVTSGNFSASEAHKLLEGVNYRADITVESPQGYVSESSKTARLLLGIAALTGIIGGTAVILGFFFGGARALVRRMRGKPASSLSDDQFIRLKLK
jgi:hypothetical protein